MKDDKGKDNPRLERALAHAKVDDDILNMKEALDYLKISRNTMYKLLKEGSIPAKQVGTRWRFSRRQLLEWIEKGA